MRRNMKLMAITILAFTIVACGQNGNQTDKSNENGKVSTDTKLESKTQANQENNTKDEIIIETKTETTVETEKEPEPNENVELNDSKEIGKFNSIDELEVKIIEDSESTLSALQAKNEEIQKNIPTYEVYKGNIDKIEEHYNMILEQENKLGIRLRKYAVEYAKLVVATDDSNKDKYNQLEEIIDLIYDDARDEMNNIYDDIIGDLKDAYYDDIISEGKKTDEYSVWSDISSDAYKMWSDASSEAYELWSDTGSDIYEFASDVRSDIYLGDKEKADKHIDKFEKRIHKLETK